MAPNSNVTSDRADDEPVTHFKRPRHGILGARGWSARLLQTRDSPTLQGERLQHTR